MVSNTGFISTLGSSPTAPIDDATDSIHSAIIMALNAASGENRAISGFGVAQGVTSSHTHYVVDAGTVLRNGKLTTITGATLTTTGDPDTGTSNAVDWYGVLVVCDGEVSGESPNTLKWRYGTSSPTTGIYDTTNATVAAITAGDIPIAVIKYAANSATSVTDRHIQFLGYAQATREFSAINSGTERLRINKEGTLTHTPSSTAYTLTLPSATGTLARTADNITGNAAGLSATLAVSSGGTGLTANTTWLNSQITTTATGALNYNGATAVAVNHDNLAGFVTAEHIDWTASSAGTIDASNYTNTTYSVFTGADGTNVGTTGLVKLPAATDDVKFLRGDSTWAVPTDTNTEYTATQMYALFAADSTNNAQFGADVTVDGDFTVSGTTTTLNKTEIDVQDAMVFSYDTGSDSFTTTLRITDPTANRIITLPDIGGTVALTSGTVAAATLASTVTIADLGTGTHDIIFEGVANTLNRDAASGLTYTPGNNTLATTTGNFNVATGSTRLLAGASSLQANLYPTGDVTSGGSTVTRWPQFEGSHDKYAELKLLALTADESSYADNIDEHGIGSAVVVESQRANHRAGLVWTHDDDGSSNNDFAWGIGRQFINTGTSGQGTEKLQIGHFDGKNYTDAFLTNTIQSVFHSDNAALTIDTSKNVTLATGITLGDTALTTAGTVFYDGALKYFDGSGEQALATTASSARTVTAGGNTLGASETLAFTAGTGITIAENAGAVTITNSVTDTNTNIDTTDLIAGLSPESGIHLTADHLAFTDATSSTTKKITLTQLMAAVTHPLIPTLPADKIDSGTFGTARIPTLAQSKVTNLATDLAAKVPTTRTIAGRALSADLVVRVNASTGKLEVNDGSSTTTIQDTAGTPVDVVFDNRKTLWTEVSGSAKPADNATIDQTGAQIKTLYEAETNAYTDAKNTKLSGIAPLATIDQTKADIKTLFSWTNDPEDGATTGATWGSNITSQPADSALLNSSVALAISGTSLTLTNAGSGVTLGKANVGLNAIADLDSKVNILSHINVAEGATKNKLFYQSTIPTSLSVGDIWVDLDDNKTYIAKIAGSNEISATEWILTTDTFTSSEKSKLGGVAAGATVGADWASNVSNISVVNAQIAANAAISADKITDGSTNKVYISADKDKLAAIAAGATKSGGFIQDAIPTSLSAGDVWVDTNDSNKQYVAKAAGSDEISSTEWVLVSTRESVGLGNVPNTDATDSDNHVDGSTYVRYPVVDRTKLVTIEEGATSNQVFYQSGTPTAISVGDIWVDSDDNKVYSASAVGAGDWELITTAYTNAEKSKLTGIAAGATATSNANNAVITLTAGTGLSGGGNFSTDQSDAETITFNVGGVTISEIAGGSLQTSSESFADNDTSLMTSAAVADKIESYGFATGSGDIEGVTAGTGLSGGGITGTVTVNLSHLGIESLSDPNQDRIFFWDDSETATKFLTVGSNLAISGTTINATNTTYSSSDFTHDDLTGFVANEHIDWTADQGTTNIHAGNYTDTNTTYSVGDGGLTQNNFTNALKSKLDGITASANNYAISSDLLDEDNMATNSATKVASQQSIKAYVDAQTHEANTWRGVSVTGGNTLGSGEALAFTAGSNVTLSESGGAITIASTNTTYSVGDGGLTQNNFTNADHSKLDGIEASATADQTNAEIRTAVEAASDSNVFTDADHTKLNAIETSATADQTASEITGLLNDVASYTLGTAGSGTITIANDLTVTGTTTTAHVETTTVNHGVVFEGTTADGYDMTLISAVADSNKTVTIPNATFTIPQQDTTYSVGDGGLTQNNFTNTLKSKLDGVASSATATVDLTVDGAGTVHANNYTNTTYSVGAGGLTQQNFTTTLKNKLDGVASSANNYTHTTNANLTGDVTSVGNATTIATDAVDIAMLSATGTASSSTFLRGDNTWVTPTDTTYSAGNSGLVPAQGTSGHFLKHDGTFGIPAYTTNTDRYVNTAAFNTGTGVLTLTRAGTDTTAVTVDLDNRYALSSASGESNTASNVGSGSGTEVGIWKQKDGVDLEFKKLKQGSNITLTSNISDITIASTNTEYTAGTGLTLSSTEFSVTNNAIGADQLNVSGDGTTSQYLRSDGDGTFTWADPDTDTNTQNEYATSWVDSDANALLRLTESGAGSGTQDIKIVAGSNITLTPSGTDLTIAATDTNTDTTYTGGTNLTLSGTTFNVDDAFLKNDANDTTTGTITAGGFTTTGSITLAGHGVADIDITSEASDADDHLMTALAIKNRIEDYGYTTNTGTTTASNTQTFTGKSGSNNQWTNDAGYITSYTNTTYLPGTGLDLTSTTFSVDVSDFMTNGSDNRILTATGADAMNAEANLTFDGSTLAVSGHIDATTKSFVIPHPTKENMTLRHGSLEGPEYGVYHRGRLIDDSTIALPEYWLGLVDDSTITVQLTANGSFQMLYVDKIENNTVHIDNATDGNIDCFYIIHGERKDIGKMEVEY